MAQPFQPNGKRRQIMKEETTGIWEEALPTTLCNQALHKLLPAPENTARCMLTEGSAGKGKITKQVRKIKIFLLHFLLENVEGEERQFRETI